MSQGDWYRHHYTPKLLLMKQLSRKMCLLSDTLCELFQVSPLWTWWENADTTMTTFLKLWDKSINRIFLPSFVSIEQGSKNFEDLLRDSRGSAEEVSVFRKVWISCTIPNPLWQTAVISFSNSFIQIFPSRMQSRDRPLTAQFHKSFFLLIMCFDLTISKCEVLENVTVQM